MNTLGDRPNLLFLIWIRNKNARFLLNHKLNKQLYYRKLIIALTTNETSNGVDGAFIIWKVNGKIHKDGGPACIFGISTENPNGTKHIYYKQGQRHRGLSQDGKVGPAYIGGISIEHPKGVYHHYYNHGKLHREDGAAIIYGISNKNPNSTYHEYHINGKRVKPF